MRGESELSTRRSRVQRLQQQRAAFAECGVHVVHCSDDEASRLPATRAGMSRSHDEYHRADARMEGRHVALSFAVNWVGVIVGNVALLVIGFVWFIPKVFGDRWTAYMGRPDEQLKPGPDFVLSILSGTLNSFVMAVLALNLKATAAGDGILSASSYGPASSSATCPRTRSSLSGRGDFGASTLHMPSSRRSCSL